MEIPFSTFSRFCFTALLLAPVAHIHAAAAGGTTQVGLSSVNDVYAVATSGTVPSNGGMDTAGYAYAANLLGTSVTWAGSSFAIGSASGASAVTSTSVSAPAGNYSTLKLLAGGAFGPINSAVITVTYTDGTTSNFTQSISDWGSPANFAGESVAATMSYRVTPTGAAQNGPWYLYGYSFALNGAKALQSITLPKQRNVVVLAIDLVQSATTLGAQSITFGVIPTQTTGTALTLSATATSGLAVNFAASPSSVCSVSGGVATFLAAGTCTITALQAGNAAYAAATSVMQTFSVTKTMAAVQTIAFTPVVTQAVSVALTLNATASSGLTVSYSSSTPSVCTVANSTVTFLSVGTCTLTASQSGNANYAAATPVSESFNVQSASSAPGYDVVLLVGQSNMVGLGTGADDGGDAAADPRIFQWNANSGAITPAFDPLYQNSSPYNIGLGMTFAKAYVKHMATNRQLLLVGAATGATGFAGGYWLTPNGAGVTSALSRVNAAMTAAGSNARLAGILWHQGENDIAYSGAAAYQSNLANLIAYLRTHITGASSTTPFVAGEMVNAWLTYNLANADDTAGQIVVLNDIHTLPDAVPFTAWTSAAQLNSDPYYSTIHFSALSQRQLGRRYADKFFDASNNLPQPQVSQNWWAGTFFDDGRGLGSVNTNSIPVNNPATVNGTVTGVTDPLRGNVARISQGQGWLSYQVPGSTFNGSYTKMAWFLPGAVGYGNNLISGNNAGQIHFLFAQSLGNSLFLIGAGHSSGAVNLAVSAQVTNAQSAWMNVALSYDSNAQTMTLYLNGAAVASQGGIAPAPASSASVLPLLMGSYGYTGSSAMDGEFAGGRAWNVALSAAQIMAIYNHESAGTANEPGFGIVVGAASQAAQSPASPGIPYSVPSVVAATGGTTPSVPVSIVPNNGFTGSPNLTLTGLPAGAAYSLAAGATTNTFNLQITGLATSSPAGRYPLVVSGSSGTVTTEAAATLCLSAHNGPGALQVDLSCYFDRGHNLVTDGTSFSDGGLAGTGFAFSANLLGTTVTSGNVQFSLGAPNGLNGLSAVTVNVPAGQYTNLALLGTGINGAQSSQPITMTYSDGTTSTVMQSLSDWGTPQNYPGESVASSMAYVDTSTGTRVNANLHLYSYSLALNNSKTLANITLPPNSNVIIMAMTLVGTDK